MTKLEKLNALLQHPGLDLPSIRRKVDPQGSNVKWLQKHLSSRNSDHDNYPQIVELLDERIGNLVKQPYEETVTS